MHAEMFGDLPMSTLFGFESTKQTAQQRLLIIDFAEIPRYLCVQHVVVRRAELDHS